MSISVSPAIVETAEILPSADDMYRMGLEASLPGAENYDIVAAHKWFNLAAMKGNSQARAYRKDLLLEMSREEVAEAQRQAREWLSTRQGVMAI